MIELSTLNIAVLAPMPSPSVMTARRVKPGLRSSDADGEAKAGEHKERGIDSLGISYLTAR